MEATPEGWNMFPVILPGVSTIFSSVPYHLQCIFGLFLKRNEQLKDYIISLEACIFIFF